MLRDWGPVGDGVKPMSGTAFSGGGLLLQAGAIALVAALLLPTLARLRIGIAVAALLGAIGFALIGALAGALWAGLLFLIASGQLLLAYGGERRVRFTEEEALLAERGLVRLPRSRARGFIDQGMWIEGRAGEVLTREGEPVSHLFYLSRGEARVLSGGVEVASVAAPAFIGEVTVLSKSGATGTVVLAGDARFWCVPGDTLRRLLAEEPDLRTLLENSFATALSEKLRTANRQRAVEQGAVAA